MIRRLLRTASAVGRDPRLPRPLRVAAGIALLPIPLFFDELLGLLVLLVVVVRYRPILTDAWSVSRV